MTCAARCTSYKDVSSSIPTIQMCMEANKSKDWYERSSPKVMMFEGKDIERGVSYLPQEKSSCLTDGRGSLIVGYKKSPIDL